VEKLEESWSPKTDNIELLETKIGGNCYPAVNIEEKPTEYE
jgi:hypothetical protein